MVRDITRPFSENLSCLLHYAAGEQERDEEDAVVSTEDEMFLVEERVSRVRKRSLVCCQYPRTRVGLLLCRGSLFVVGAALVIGAGVSSQYHPPVGHGNYSECSSNTSDYEEQEYTTDVPVLSTSISIQSSHVISPTRTTTSLSLQTELGRLIYTTPSPILHF